MLKLTLGGVVVDLLDNQLSIVQTSPYPLVANSSSGGNFIYNFTLPATDELKRIMKFFHRPQARDHSVEVPFTIDAAGLVYEGIAKISEASSRQYEVFCPVGNGNFNKAIKELKLNEIDLGGERLFDKMAIEVVATTEGSLEYNSLSYEPFEETIIVGFTNITLNTGGCLNLNGASCSLSSSEPVSITFDFSVQVLSGLMNFNLFLNGELYTTYQLTENAIENITLPDGFAGRVSWELFVQNSASNTPDMYEIDATLSEISLHITGGNVTILEDPSRRYPEIDFAIFPVENPEIFANWDDDFYAIDNVSIKVLYSQFFKVVNYFKDGYFPSILNGMEDNTVYSAGNICIPFPYIAYLIKRIAFHFNYRIENNPFEDELKYVVLINHFCENQFLTDNTKLITPKEGFNLQDHVPDMTLYDFLKHLCNLFAMGYEVNNEKNTITFNFLNDIVINEDYEDISHLVIDDLQVQEQDVKGAKVLLKFPSADKYFSNVKEFDGLNYKGELNTTFNLPNPGALNDLYFVKLSNAYFAWKYNPETYTFGWVMHSHNYVLEKEIGEDLKEISPELVPVMMKYVIKDDTLGAPEGRQWLIPASHQPGKFEGAPETFQTKWQGLLSFYHGVFPSYPSGSYPFGSPDINDLWGDPIPGLELSLKLNGEKGLYEKKWRKYLEWRIKAVPVKVKIIPDRTFLQNLSFSKKKMINGVKYILVDFRGNISKKGPEIAELTLLAM